MPKFLCLPGYLQNGKMFAEKSSGLRKILTKKYSCQLDYVDPQVMIGAKEQLPFQLSSDEVEASAKWNALVEQDVTRAWWKHQDPGNYEGFSHSFSYLKKYIQENGPYDGIIGFSQGAAMAAIICNSVVRESMQDAPFKVAVFFSGFVFTEPIDPTQDKLALTTDCKDIEEYIKLVQVVPGYEEYFTVTPEVQQSTKIINVFGSSDNAVPAIRSKQLTKIFRGDNAKSEGNENDDQVIEFQHDGGHFIPNKKQFLQPMVDVIVKELGSTSNL
ncbi:family of serine hydrolases 1 [[Candida] anglica]|uniref:Family of serine hydrolases 1 n=1 Tax=[Candida] anglica TaxID=148631 RepID=A0ABP0EBX8_9ASCO